MFGLERAKLLITNASDGAEEKLIDCAFNPETCVFQKSNPVTRDKTGGQTGADGHQSSATPARLTLELWFDTYALGADVRRMYTDSLWAVMLPAPATGTAGTGGAASTKSKKSSPGAVAGGSAVRFVWGNSWSFKGVITDMTQTFSLFLPNGTPVRAKVNLTLEQAEDVLLTPADGGALNLLAKVAWAVTEGQNLAWIAQRALGDASAWREIASANALTDVRDLVSGTMLEIKRG